VPAHSASRAHAQRKEHPKCSAAPPSPRPLCSRPAPCCSAPAPAAPPSPSATGTPDPDATVAVRLVSEPSNLDIRETAGAALDQILIDNVYQGLVSRTPDQEIVDTLASSHRSRPTASPTRSRSARGHLPRRSALTPQDVVWSLQQVKDTATYRDSDRSRT
jgi:peptide/nickel transport system substrate-binding protein